MVIISGSTRLAKGSLAYFPSFLKSSEADRALTCLWNELEWTQQAITIFGKKVMQPRLIAWHGELDAIYSYSGLSLKPNPWHPLLEELKFRIEAKTGHRFNSVLANAYRDGKDSMGWHRDDERELGPGPLIASLSLGGERRFLIREEGKRSADITLEHGSLLVMKGEFQRKYQHSLPKTRRQVDLRINLTYRHIRNQAPV